MQKMKQFSAPDPPLTVSSLDKQLQEASADFSSKNLPNLLCIVPSPNSDHNQDFKAIQGFFMLCSINLGRMTRQLN